MKKCLVICLAFLLTSCMGYRIYSKYNKFEGTQYDSMMFNFVNVEKSILSTTRVGFNFGRWVGKDKSILYDLKIYYSGSEWLFIPNGETLVLLIDGERIGLSGNGSSQDREVISGDMITETALYDIDKALIKKIMNAKIVEFQLRGEYSLNGQLTEENLSRIKEFYNTYIN